MKLEGAATAAAERTRYRDHWYGRRQTVDPTRVLIVDGNLVRGASTAKLVHAVGRFATNRAGSVQAALIAANELLPSVVLLSMDFPDLTSYSLAATLHGHQVLSSARLIALTVNIGPGDREHALAVGFEQYLMLPVQQIALERVLLRTPGGNAVVKRRSITADKRRRH